jgi:hypothetical protein
LTLLSRLTGKEGVHGLRQGNGSDGWTTLAQENLKEEDVRAGPFLSNVVGAKADARSSDISHRETAGVAERGGEC